MSNNESCHLRQSVQELKTIPMFRSVEGFDNLIETNFFSTARKDKVQRKLSEEKLEMSKSPSIPKLHLKNN